jgi:hypothetical protein
MENKGYNMIQIKQIIRFLAEDKKSIREIIIFLGLSRKAVTEYILLYRSTGLSYADIKSMSEGKLSSLMKKQEEPNINRLEILECRFHQMEHDLKSVGVTKQLLWSEYKVEHPDG